MALKVVPHVRVAGFMFGRTPLISLSPKKTVEVGASCAGLGCLRGEMGSAVIARQATCAVCSMARMHPRWQHIVQTLLGESQHQCCRKCVWFLLEICVGQGQGHTLTSNIRAAHALTLTAHVCAYYTHIGIFVSSSYSCMEGGAGQQLS